MLLKRVVTSILLLGGLLLVLWTNSFFPAFAIAAAICALLGAWEFYRMVGASGKGRPVLWLGLVLTLLFVIAPALKWDHSSGILISIAVAAPLLWVILRRDHRDAFSSWAFTLAGILYLGWLSSRYTALIRLDDGYKWVVLALFCTFASDTTAFFVGRLLGRHKMAPSISPAKTWEGAAGGLAGAIILGSLIAWILKLPLSLWQVSLLATATSVFAQAGDLVESLFKRNMGTKDSGHALPGHGGMLDRVDGIVFAGLVVYYYVIWHG
ncbi:MAG: phosphatidate cytidylyltransferase [Dehalococcoidia bacterium]|nr:phosphatidate cytidylyltransferase [Dehalococcoidia bacterium]